MKKQTKNTFVLSDPSEILEALVGLKEVRVLHYERSGPDVSLVIEQIVVEVHCPDCQHRAQVKERPLVSYIDLPVYGFPMRLTWKKHRMRCVNAECAKKTWVLGDHRIAAKDCLLTTRAAKWATRQVGYGRTVKEVAGELSELRELPSLSPPLCRQTELASPRIDRGPMNVTPLDSDDPL